MMTMSLFYKSDDRARNMVRLAIGLHKYRYEVDAFFGESIYWASISFEHIIRLTAKSISRDIDDDACARADLNELIDNLCNSSRVKRSQRENLNRKLTSLRLTRNRIFHPEGYINDRQVTGLLKAISEMVGSNLEKVRGEITYEQLRQLRDKVLSGRFIGMPRTPHDIDIPDKGEICDSDFEDLDVLYEKCKYLHFRKLKNFLSPLRLKPEEMSELIPTTGTIWLPWVAREPGWRTHIRTIVLGANFTPTLVRIGTDLGGEAHEAKKTYYTLLLNGDFDSLFDKLDNEYYFIDTFWYNYVRRKQPIKDYFPTKTREFKLKVKIALEETIEKAKTKEPMKGHQLLIGKIFNRGTKEFSDFLVNPPRTIRGIFSDLLAIVKRVEDHLNESKNY